MFCQSCGKQVAEESGFCVHCGSAVGGRVEETTEAAIVLPAPSGSEPHGSPNRLSAGTAFLLSLIVPGAGQFYCGKKRRALYTFLFWAGGLVLMFVGGSEALVEIGLSVAYFLCIFGFVDAYLTAREINSGLDVIIDENPRVAAVLNVLTWGIGYFYVGQRKKGLVLFLMGGYVGSVLTRNLSGWGPIFILVLQLLLAWDAYRIAQAEIDRRIGTLLPREELRPESSRLPVAIPLAVAGLLLLVLVGLSIAGVMMGSGVSASGDLTP